jgi:hypothetical protein
MIEPKRQVAERASPDKHTAVKRAFAYDLSPFRTLLTAGHSWRSCSWRAQHGDWLGTGVRRHPATATLKIGTGLRLMAGLVLIATGCDPVGQQVNDSGSAGGRAGVSSNHPLKTEADSQRDPTLWLESFSSMEASWTEDVLEVQPAAALQQFIEGQAAEVDVAALQEFARCSQFESGGATFVGLPFTDVWTRLEKPAPALALGKCERLAIKALAGGASEALSTALRAREFDSIASARLWAERKRDGALFPDASLVARLFEPCRLVVLDSVTQALSGQYAVCLDRLEIGFEFARLSGESLWLVDHLAWCQLNWTALQGVRLCLPQFVGGADLTVIERTLRQIEGPMIRLRAALIGEQSVGIRALRENARSFKVGAGARREEQLYCESIAEGLAYIDSGRYESQFQWHRPDLILAPASLVIVPDLDLHIDCSIAVEMERRLGLLALIALKFGETAGFEAASQTVDLFSGKSVRAKLSPDHVFTIWSIGPNRLDEDGNRAPGLNSRFRYDGSADLSWHVLVQ